MSPDEYPPKKAVLQDILDLLETFPAQTIRQLLQEWEKEALESGWMSADWYHLTLTEKRYTKTWKSEKE